LSIVDAIYDYVFLLVLPLDGVPASIVLSEVVVVVVSKSPHQTDPRLC